MTRLTSQWLALSVALPLVACGGGGGGANSDALGSGGGDGRTADAATSCAGTVAPVALADFESGSIPSSENGATEGFRNSDVARGTIVTPGANGTTSAAQFSFATDTSIFFQGNNRPQYLDGSGTYDASLANALSFWINIPSGSGLLSATAQTFSIFTYHYKPGDPWVGPNSGANLTDSQMHGYGPMRFDPSGAGKWLHVVMAPSAFDHSRGNYHFYATRAVVEDLEFIPSMRQFQPIISGDLSTGPQTAQFDEFQLVTLCPTVNVAPESVAKSVSASGGDVVTPIVLANPSDHSRTYHAIISSTIGVDRQTLEAAMHATDDIATIDDLQGGVAGDGGLGAAELFADDGTGAPTGSSIIPAGIGITVAAHGTWNGVIVHHVTAGMLGSQTGVMSDAMTFQVTRNTLVTSAVFWDPSEPRLSDPAVVFTGSNTDTGHPAPPGFPTYQAPPTGWGSTDVPPDQVGAYFTSVLTLTP